MAFIKFRHINSDSSDGNFVIVIVVNYICSALHIILKQGIMRSFVKGKNCLRARVMGAGIDCQRTRFLGLRDCQGICYFVSYC